MVDDLISRKAAIDAIDEYERLSAMSQTVRNMTSLREIVQRLPPAQPENVRCKDCKHRHLDGMIWSCPFGLSGGEDFFCAYGAVSGR